MFPKAPRFVEKVVDGPAPGDYDPNLPGEPDPHKRGAFLEKTARFRESQNAPDTFGLYDPSAPGPSTASKPRPRPSAPVNVAADRERAKKELEDLRHRLTTSHAKEMSRLEARIARCEARIEELNKEKADLSRECDTKTLELKSVSAKLAQQSSHTALIPTLQRKLEDLTNQHAASKQKRQEEIAQLTKDLKTSQVELKRRESESEKVKGLVEAERRKGKEELEKAKSAMQEENERLVKDRRKLKGELDRLQTEDMALKEKVASLDAELKRERLDLGKAKEDLQAMAGKMEQSVAQSEAEEANLRSLITSLSAAASQSLSNRPKIDPSTVSKIRTDLLASQLLNYRYERKLGAHETQVSALVDLVSQLEEERSFWMGRWETSESQAEYARALLRSERDEAKLQREEDAREIEVSWAIRDQMIGDMQANLEDVAARWSAEATISSANEAYYLARIEDLQNVLMESTQALSSTRSEVSTLSSETIPKLEDELASIKSELESTRTHLSSAEGRLQEMDMLRKQLTDDRRTRTELEERLDAMTKERRKEDELREKERDERRKLVGLLGQSRAAEQGLKEDLEEALKRISSLENLKSTHNDLCRTINELARRNSMAEQDAKQLSEINAGLIGHANTHQKIRQLDRIRTDLATQKKKNVQVSGDLAMAKAENDDLRREIEAYKSIGTVGRETGPTRSKVSRPALTNIGTNGNIGTKRAGGKPKTALPVANMKARGLSEQFVQGQVGTPGDMLSAGDRSGDFEQTPNRTGSDEGPQEGLGDWAVSAGTDDEDGEGRGGLDFSDDEGMLPVPDTPSSIGSLPVMDDDFAQDSVEEDHLEGQLTTSKSIMGGARRMDGMMTIDELI